MRKTMIVMLCILTLILAGIVHAAPEAKVIADSTAPGGAARENYNSLKFDASEGESIHYTVPNAARDTEYTLSFYYKLANPEGEPTADVMRFSLEVEGSEARDFYLTSDSGDWELFTYTFRTPVVGSEPEAVEPELKVTLTFRADNVWTGSAYLDNLQLINAPEYVRFNNFQYEYGCCPPDFCWTGDALPEFHSCVDSGFYENDVTMPPIGYNIADFNADGQASNFLLAPSGFRCIGGEWKFSRIKHAPLYDKAGYCPDETQCFTGTGETTLARDNCVDSGSIESVMVPEPTSEFSSERQEYFYCYNGNWTTRTKEIALQLQAMTTDADTYTIFCDDFRHSLNSYDSDSWLYHDYFGDFIFDELEYGGVSEFCVMNLNGKVIAGVSLFQPINEVPPAVTLDWIGGSEDPEEPEGKSFMQLLKGPDANSYCDGAIAAGEVAEDGTAGAEHYVSCAGNDVFYNPKLKTVLFAKPHTGPGTIDERQDVPYNPPAATEPQSFIGEIWQTMKDVIKRLLGISTLTQEEPFGAGETRDFIENAGSFDKLYINHHPDGPNGQPRTIRALRETRATIDWSDEDGDGVLDTIDGPIGYKTFISAEYMNYQTPICKFFEEKLGEQDTLLRAQISSEDTDVIQCTPVILDDDSWMYEVYVEDPIIGAIPYGLSDVSVWIGQSDSFWNDITAKIRTRAPPTPDPDASYPSAPAITHAPERAVADQEIEFIAQTADEDIIAVLWDFGDGKTDAYSSNPVTYHRYDSIGPYDIRVCVMNSDYLITCVDDSITVETGPSVVISPYPQSDVDKLTGVLVADIVLGEGTPPYDFTVEWGDGTSDSYADVPAGAKTVSHTYDSSFDPGVDSIEKRIVVRGEDSAVEHVSFDNARTVYVLKT